MIRPKLHFSKALMLAALVGLASVPMWATSGTASAGLRKAAKKVKKGSKKATSKVTSIGKSAKKGAGKAFTATKVFGSKYIKGLRDKAKKAWKTTFEGMKGAAESAKKYLAEKIDEAVWTAKVLNYAEKHKSTASNYFEKLKKLTTDKSLKGALKLVLEAAATKKLTPAAGEAMVRIAQALGYGPKSASLGRRSAVAPCETCAPAGFQIGISAGAALIGGLNTTVGMVTTFNQGWKVGLFATGGFDAGFSVGGGVDLQLGFPTSMSSVGGYNVGTTIHLHMVGGAAVGIDFPSDNWNYSAGSNPTREREQHFFKECPSFSVAAGLGQSAGVTFTWTATAYTADRWVKK